MTEPPAQLFGRRPVARSPGPPRRASARPVSQATRRVHGLEERRLRLLEPGRLDVGGEGRRRRPGGGPARPAASRPYSWSLGHPRLPCPIRGPVSIVSRSFLASAGERTYASGADSRAAPVGRAAAACFRRRRAPTVALATLLRDQPLSTRRTSFALERGRLTGRSSAPAPGCSARPRSARRTPPADRARTATPPTASA